MGMKGAWSVRFSVFALVGGPASVRAGLLIEDTCHEALIRFMRFLKNGACIYCLI
jgi:hypothetical protein